MLLEHFLLATLLGATSLAGCTRPDAAAVAPGEVAAAASGASPAASPVAAGASLPAEIVAFRARRDACDHFRGEEPYDAQRAAFLATELTRNCTGTDRALADLRGRYAGNAQAMAALKDYEDKIE